MDKMILVVDDEPLDRGILKDMLDREYDVIEAGDGKEALGMLAQHKKSIVAVLLDLTMPQMDGFALLEAMREDEDYRSIPALVLTASSDEAAELKAFQCGAWDFITKPFHKDILDFRLKNAISRSNLSAFRQLTYIAEYDVLTDIYNKEKFFHQTKELLHANPDQKYCCISFDINRFQLINSFYGTKEGDRMLKHVARTLRQEMEKRHDGSTYGRIDADIFVFCIPFKEAEKVEEEIKELDQKIRDYDLNFDIVITYGIYVIEDNSMPVGTIYDRSRLAARQAKGKYINSYAFYTEELTKKLETEQKITNEMNDALKEGQFIVYLQPKYNIRNNRLSGAEALVRWKHPKEGMISPGTFIPVFERNGFITRLDYYIWEQVCMLLRKWMDEGIMPRPISVNVSRVNLYNPKFVEMLCTLTEKYRLPRNLLQLELTESAYTDNPQIIKEAMSQLHEKGFTVLMDDFGSGYSSLNTLKDIQVDILKIDMKFFEKSEIRGRGENITASVVRMAKWLHMPTIAEGVEEKEQVDFLRGIGCEFVQGYYFAKPMPVEEYERIARENGVFEDRETEEEGKRMMAGFDSRLEKMFSNVMQAIGIYEYSEDGLELIEVNNAFYELFGWEDRALHSDNLMEVVRPEDRQLFMETIGRAARTKGKAECEYGRLLSDGRSIWVQIKLKYISHVGNKSILVGSLTDITEQREVEMELSRYRTAILNHKTEYGKILVVDDEKRNRDRIRAVFEDEYEVLEAENGEAAIGLLKENNYEIDVIFLDLAMPVMDGIRFLEEKKKDEGMEEIPVIVITSDDTSQKQIQAITLGASDYIVKPFVGETLRKRTRNVLESKRNLEKYVHVAKENMKKV